MPKPKGKKMRTLWKSLPKNLAPNGFKFKPGVWYRHEGEMEMCRAGFHCSKNILDAMSYVDCEKLAMVEVRGKHLKQDDKQCWEEMRLAKVWNWEKKDSVSLAIFAAELVLPNFEKEHPDDKRPRKAIEAAKAVLRNDSKKNRDAAESAARAAESAARAAESAAWSAAWSAESAAWSAAWSAAESAAWSAKSAAKSAESAARAAESAEYNSILKECHKFVEKRLEKKKPIYDGL